MATSLARWCGLVAIAIAVAIVVVERFATVDLFEVGDDIASFRQLGQIDLAAADQIEHDVSELGEGFLTAARRERGVEATATFSRAALEGVAERAGLRQRGAQQRAKCASELGTPEASTSSLPCHASSVYRRRVVRRLVWLGLIVGVAGCPPPDTIAPPLPPVSGGKVRVRVFTEPAPVKTVGTAGRFLFVATEDALLRWDDSGALMTMSADHGLPGSHVVALATDRERKWMWILTDGGLGHYDASAEVYRETLPPPAALGIDYAVLAKNGASLAPAVEGGAWLGTLHGLYFVSKEGAWAATTTVKDGVRALVRDRAGWLWIATKHDGLVARKPNGDLVKVGSAQGCEVVEPRLLVEAAGDRVMVIGVDEQGHERLALGSKLSWTSYRTMPEIKWDAATGRGDTVVLMGGDHVYRVGPVRKGKGAPVRPLARDGVRLVALTSSDASAVTTGALAIEPMPLVVPPGATALAATDEQLLIGTRDLGTARYRESDARPQSWLRNTQMFADATSLSVACVREQDCWVATGARQAWHWNGERFSASGPDDTVVAVARDPAGPIYALHRGVDASELHLSRIDGAGTWQTIAKVVLSGRDVSFARFASPGVLWVGLQGEGVAIVEPATAKVTYHHTEQHDVVGGDVRGETAWFATNDGVARLVGDKITSWTGADGGLLKSEVGGDGARAVTIAPDGNVIVATGAGVGVWDGKTWTFPPALRFAINDVVATRNGHVWMATERGLAAWDGKRLRRVDMRRGLAENQVLDVAVDQYDRVWARGPGSLTLISQ